MKKLVKGLREFKANYYSTHKELFEQLSHGQKPRVLFITCSDSRVDPNLITQAGVGELFVIRNAGNIIPPYGATNGGEGATIEYAVQALCINQIIICGHSHCGAMKGLMKLNKLQSDMPLVFDWLKYAEATRRALFFIIHRHRSIKYYLGHTNFVTEIVNQINTWSNPVFDYHLFI
ncbi:MAG: carbonic anhydrase, partial [Cyanobacteria bacterium J06641_2]